MKHRIFRFLVQEMGFRAFAMETGWEGAQLAATYVRTRSGTVEDAIKPHINVWHGREYADLVKWMADWNATHPESRRQADLLRLRYSGAERERHRPR
jgi:erythromycin esterase